MRYEPKTVWVLGSGFSRSLGGPLLDELIGPRAEQDTTAVFPDLGSREIVYLLFRRHRGTLWAHAEEFLDFIDTALLSYSPRRRILEHHLNSACYEALGADAAVLTVEDLRDQAILTVAAECSTYTDHCDVRAEAWGPYLEWAYALSHKDTIVTFNYDLVLEKLAGAENVCAIGPSTVAFPTGEADGRIHLVRGRGVTEIFKLHGSVDWLFKEGAETKRLARLHDAINSDGYRLLIATPGATKSRYVNKMLRVVWGRAMGAIEEAEVIVFMGYRFPPSDSEARGRMLAALRQNKRPFVKVHTVLGPNLNEPDTVRLVALLTHTLKGAGRFHVSELPQLGQMPKKPPAFDVVARPLYAQDFMTVMHASEMFDANIMHSCSPIP